MFKRITFVAVVLLFASYAAADNTTDISLVNFCTSCHGTNGHGPGQTIPFIGGQTKEYLNKSFNEIRAGERHATIMHIITQGYNPDEINTISGWFSSREWQNSANPIDETLAEEGKTLATPCQSCHGRLGKGAGPTPRIAGQPAQYLYFSMLEYKNNMRNHKAMTNQVIDLSDEKIRALAEYFSGLR